VADVLGMHDLRVVPHSHHRDVLVPRQILGEGLRKEGARSRQSMTCDTTRDRLDNRSETTATTSIAQTNDDFVMVKVVWIKSI
jgi:hypothetical protein